jgi:acetyl/propionyl-CoA carboxylase alpha subunit
MNNIFSKKYSLEFNYAHQSVASPVGMEGVIQITGSSPVRKVNLQFQNETGASEEINGVEVNEIDGRRLSYSINGEKRSVNYYWEGLTLHFFDAEGNEVEVKSKGEEVTLVGKDEMAGSHSNEIMSPMPGTVLKVNCAVGDEVKKGTPLLVMEAMKMEHVIRAPKDIKIKSVSAVAGRFIGGNKVLITFE